MSVYEDIEDLHVPAMQAFTEVLSFVFSGLLGVITDLSGSFFLWLFCWSSIKTVKF